MPSDLFPNLTPQQRSRSFLRFMMEAHHEAMIDRLVMLLPPDWLHNDDSKVIDFLSNSYDQLGQHVREKMETQYNDNTTYYHKVEK